MSFEDSDSKSSFVHPARFVVKLSFTVKGSVKERDIHGAIFNQTVKWLDPEDEFERLQWEGEMDKIRITPTIESGMTSGEVVIPMNADFDRCTRVASSISLIKKVGTSKSIFKFLDIEDKQSESKENMKKIAHDIKLKYLMKNTQLGTYGDLKLPHGPSMDDAPWLILVEGKAEIVNLLNAEYGNTLAIGGSNVHPSIIEKCNEKKNIVAFLDGNSTGRMLMHELEQQISGINPLHPDKDEKVKDLSPKCIEDLLKPIENKISDFLY